MSLEHCSSVFSGQVYCGCFEPGKKMRPGLFQKHYALCDGVGMHFIFKEPCIINFLPF